MDPVTVEVTIARPCEEVFDYLADIANHAEFCDHYLVEWHLTREDPYAAGAGARFLSRPPPQLTSRRQLTRCPRTTKNKA